MSAMNPFSHLIRPVLHNHEYYIASMKVWPMNQHHPQILFSAFWLVQYHCITDNLLLVLDAIGSFTLYMNHYLLGAPISMTLGQVSRTRTAIQKRLLLQPTTEELNTSRTIILKTIDLVIESNTEIYEYTHLEAVIFGVAVVTVVAPIPDTYDVLQI
jgi:hypothetical protein